MAVDSLAPAVTEPSVSRFDGRVKLFNRICVGVLIAFAVIWIVPLAWALDTALKPNSETTATTWAIHDPTLGAFSRTLQDTDIVRWFGSSLIIAASPRSGRSSWPAWPPSRSPGCGSATATSSSGWCWPAS